MSLTFSVLNDVLGLFHRFATQILPRPAVASIFSKLKWEEAAGILWLLSEKSPAAHARLLPCIGDQEKRTILSLNSKALNLPNWRCIDWEVSPEELYMNSFDACRPVFFESERFVPMDYYPVSKLHLVKQKFRVDQLAFSPKQNLLAVLGTELYHGIPAARAFSFSVYKFADEKGQSCGVLAYYEELPSSTSQAISLQWSPEGGFLALFLHTGESTNFKLYGYSENYGGILSKIQYQSVMLSHYQTCKVWIDEGLLFVVGKFAGRTTYLRLRELQSSSGPASFQIHPIEGPSFYPLGPLFVYPGKQNQVFEVVNCCKGALTAHHILRVTNLWNPSLPAENFALPGLIIDFGFSPERELILLCKLRHQPPQSCENVFRGRALQRWKGDFSLCSWEGSKSGERIQELPFSYTRTHKRFFQRPGDDAGSEKPHRLVGFPPNEILGRFQDFADSDDDVDDDDDDDET